MSAQIPLVERLEEESLAIQRVAWARLDGGLDCSLSAELADEAAALITKLVETLEFYANPEIYEPHPHGPAFDRRDLSFAAKGALAHARGEEVKP